MWRGHTIWHGGSQGEGNTKVLSPQRASIQSEPLGAWTWNSALAVPEIGRVTWRISGDSPSVMSQHKLTGSLPFSKFFSFGWINYMVSLVLSHFPLLRPGASFVSWDTPLWGCWILRWVLGAQWLLSAGTGWRLHVSSLREFKADWWAQRKLWGREGISGILKTTNSLSHMESCLILGKTALDSMQMASQDDLHWDTGELLGVMRAMDWPVQMGNKSS